MIGKLFIKNLIIKLHIISQRLELTQAMGDCFADNLCESFEQKINQFINNNGGSSGINMPIHNRPDWDEVKDVLKGNKPIGDLGCD